MAKQYFLPFFGNFQSNNLWADPKDFNGQSVRTAGKRSKTRDHISDDGRSNSFQVFLRICMTNNLSMENESETEVVVLHIAPKKDF